MFSLVVLFTLFLGLVGVLVVFSEWQRRRRARGGDAATNLLLLHTWLADHGCHTPTTEEAIHVLNKVACKRAKSEDWSNLEVSSLLPHTLPPEFSINNVEFHSNECFQFVGRVTWPRCTPGVRVVTEVEGVRVTYNMQFDYLLAEVRVCFALRDGGLLVSMEHTSPPQMALSCAVLSPHVKEPESLASSVADGVQQLLMNLRLSDIMISRPVPPSETGGRAETNNIGQVSSSPTVPTVLVSAPEEVEEEEQEDNRTGAEGQDSVTREKEEEDSGVEEEGEEGTAPANGRNEKLDFTVKEESTDCVASHQCEAGGGGEEEEGEEERRKSEAGSTASNGGSRKEEEEEEGGNTETRSTASGGASRKEEKEREREREQPPPEDALDSPSSPPSSSQLPAKARDGTPPSPRWRRSPSYEKLQEMVFSSSPTSSLSRPNPRRSHTLSLSGSDVFREEPRYSSDDELPSTLVFEVSGPRLRHIVALSPAHASKLRRRLSHATKLHIYNDHIFIATHFRQRQKLCAVCQEKISGTFGKQGYSCRDCEMVVHKHCHYKVEKVCDRSTVSTMNLIYPESVSTVSSM